MRKNDRPLKMNCSMNKSTHAFFEPRFGHDFIQVRVCTTQVYRTRI